MERMKATLDRQGIDRMNFDSDTLMKVENFENIRMENQTL